VHDDRGPDEADPEAVDGRRRADARHLVLHDGLLHGGGAAPPYSTGHSMPT
jgi:hypothetical protein